MRVRIGGKLAGVVDDVIGLAEIRKFFSRWADQHVAHEEGMISAGTNDAYLQAIARVPTGKTIAHVKLFAAGVEIIDSTLAIDNKHLLVEFDVDWSPPNVAAAVGDDRQCVCRAGCGRFFFAGANDQRATIGDGRVLDRNGIFVKCGGGSGYGPRTRYRFRGRDRSSVCVIVITVFQSRGLKFRQVQHLVLGRECQIVRFERVGVSHGAKG